MCPAGMVWVVAETAIVKSPAPSVAEAVLPVPPLAELTLAVVLSLEPEVVGVTFTLTAHELLSAILPPVKLMVVSPAAGANVPPHVLLEPGTAATCRPVGKVSLTATPLKAVPVFGLVMVKVRVEVPPTAVVVGEKALLILGGATTVSVTVLLLEPVPPSVEVTAPVVLDLVPAVLPVTFTLMVQGLLSAILPPLRLMLLLAAVAVRVPPHVLLAPFGVATISPETRVSEKATPLKAVPVLGLVMVNVTLVEPLSGILLAPNALVMVGGATTVRAAALLVLPAPVSAELMAPVVLDLVPADVPVTFTLMEHEPIEASVPPVKLMVLEPAVSDTVPVHVVLAPLGEDTTKPAGRLSVKATPVSAKLEFGLLMLNVKLVEPFSGIVAAPKALLMVGGLATVSVAILLVVPVPPFVELIVPVVLSLVPEVVPFTSMLMVHVPLAARVPLARLIELEPATAVTVPPHTPTTLGAAATCKPATSVSPKAMPFSVVPVFGLLIVNVMVDVPFTPIVVGENALLMVGAATTVTLSLQALLLSLLSATMLLGSTEQVPPVGLA